MTGVVRDFHQETLKNRVDPTVLLYEPLFLRTFLIKVETRRLPQTVAALEDTWHERFPAYPMEYHFLDDLYASLYQGERVQLQLLYAFSLLAVGVAFLGLFGLMAYSLEARAREVAVRRVLGAEALHVIRLVGRRYFRVLLVGGVPAVPLSAWAMGRWLDTFAYQVALPWYGYGLALGGVALLLLAMVTAQTLRAVRTNPADVLREG